MYGRVIVLSVPTICLELKGIKTTLSSQGLVSDGKVSVFLYSLLSCL